MAHFSAPGRSRIPQTFRQVAVVWKHLIHATIDPPQLISDRMPGGNLTEYIASRCPDADRISLVSDLSASSYETLIPSSVIWRRRRSQPPAFTKHDSRRP